MSTLGDMTQMGRKLASAGGVVMMIVAGLFFTVGVRPARASTTTQTYSFAPDSVTATVTDNVSEDQEGGQYPITIYRGGDTSSSSYICWGASNSDAEAGTNFVKVPGGGAARATFKEGQTSATVYLTINDQGINGPARHAFVFLYNCGSPGVATLSPDATLNLLQDDPLQTRLAGNPLNYATPTDGDPLQFVNWYVFGTQTPAGRASITYRKSHPNWARAAHVIAFTPGSMSYRYWMWSLPASTLAKVVEMQLADDQQSQPNTTIALSTYSLVHGKCQNPSAIASRYENWISQLAAGIGNFRVVIYLEEDALLTNRCVSRAQRSVRENLIAYAVRALEADPHVVVYIDAGASDALISPRQMANMLRASDVAQAQGFAVNATHFQWTTTEVHWGQQISALLGGAHFVVQTDSNGRGPLLNKHPITQGIEDLCNPPGRALGPLSWRTGYEYVDGFLWLNNAGNSGGRCQGGPPVPDFWPAYAAGLVQRRVYNVTGPRYRLLRSQTNM